MYKFIRFIFFTAYILALNTGHAQNIFSGEMVQVVGSFNGYVTTPHGGDYRTTTYQRLSTNTGTPADGRGQWATTINVQNSGGDVAPVNMTGGGGNGFLFISGPAGNRFQNKWVFSGIAQATPDAVNENTDYNNGNDMGLNMSTPGYYSFVFNDCGYTLTNARFYVGYTSTAPVQPNRTGEMLNPDGTSTITITTSAAPSAQEKIYVRYVINGDFSGAVTTHLVQASPSGGDLLATIPAQSPGSVISYYVFTSTLTLAQLNSSTEINRSLARLRYDDNGGSNYVYIAGALPVNISAFWGTSSDNAITIRWLVEQEVNMQQYDVYKSYNGVAFTLLKTMPAAGNSSTQLQYTVVDNLPSTNGNYYKMISSSRDGKRVSTKIIRVYYLAIDNKLTIYPNPVNDQLNISITALNRGMYQLSIFNDAGQQVYTQPYEHNGFDRTLHLTLPATIKKGPYRLYISNKYEFYKGSFIVQY